ncbi:MAG: phosphate signaling complex protein PhoU [Planctomycetota bacterium]|nr:phosphate signaling complex protein PhoU [Planctomycetota bacterium]
MAELRSTRREDPPMAAELTDQLLELRRSILSMGAIVDARLEHVVDALVEGNFPAAREVRHGDREVDSMELDIEEMCLQVLALQQPVARDLRFVLAILRINTELERIGDLAKSVAKRILHLDTLGHAALPESVREMARAVRSMLADALNALSDNDVELARRIRRNDEDIDEFQRTVLGWAQDEILAHSTKTEAAIDVMTIARALERIGDLCANVAEDIVFLVEGRVLRHSRT